MNDSQDLSRHGPQTELATQPSFTQELSLRRRPRRKYGNMKVLLQTERILITLGADWICFTAAFLAFLAAGAFLILEVNTAFDSPWFKTLNCIFVIAQSLSYLNIAVSNPGIVLEETLNSEEREEVERICMICNLRMARGTYHCRDCDVCIRNYDHHCPWTSKCIGGSNLKRFYLFLGITPVYIVYYMVVVLVAFAMQAGGEGGDLKH